VWGGGTGPARKWGHTDIAGNFFFRPYPSTFFGSTSTIRLVVSVSAFVIVSAVWSVSCFLFFYSRCPPHAQPFVKLRGTCPRALWSRRHCLFATKGVFHLINRNRFRIHRISHQWSFRKSGITAGNAVEPTGNWCLGASSGVTSAGPPVKKI